MTLCCCHFHRHSSKTLTFISSGRLSKTARNQISGQAQRSIRSSVDVFDQHVHARVLPLRGQLEQLIESLRQKKTVGFDSGRTGRNLLRPSTLNLPEFWWAKLQDPRRFRHLSSFHLFAQICPQLQPGEKRAEQTKPVLLRSFHESNNLTKCIDGFLRKRLT